MAPVTIRDERPEDIPAVHRLMCDAVSQETEADPMDRLRERGAATLSLVADQDGQVVGHILFSPVTIGSGDAMTTVQGLAPMAVHPAFQRQGIGSLLVKTGIDRLRRIGHRAVVVPGHKDHYPRFGFVPASRYGIRSEHDVPDDVVLALELLPGGLQGCAGIARYAQEFSGDE